MLDTYDKNISGLDFGDLIFVSKQFFYIKSANMFCNFKEIRMITPSEEGSTPYILWSSDETTALVDTDMQQVGDFLAFYKV